MLKPIEFSDIKHEKKFTILEYQSLFTLEELSAIEEASLTNATIRVLQRLHQSAQFIYLSDERTLKGMEMLVQLGLLTQDRYDEILSYKYDL